MAVDYTFNPPIGIDLGTTFSVTAKWNGSAPESYRTGEQRKKNSYQSIVWYDKKNDKHLTDTLAYKRWLRDPDFGVIGVKRLMDNSEEKIMLGDKAHSPMEISGMILKGMYEEVCGQYPEGKFVNRSVVVTVPYYFKANQCANTRHAVELAGLDCIGIIQEPIAASLQYALKLIQDDPDKALEELMLVFDLGGGTFDLTLFKLTINKEKIAFEVMASTGDDRLGGLDFDDALVNYILEQEGIKKEVFEGRLGRLAWANLMVQCNELKESLSTTEEWPLIVPNLGANGNVQRDVTQAEFETCIEPYLVKIRGHIEDVFNLSGIQKSDVTRVIKVGGSSKIPVMDRLIEEAVGPNRIYADTDDALSVAEGAAIYAAYLDDPDVFGREIEIGTRAAHALGIEIEEGLFYEVIPINCKTPCQRSQIFVPSAIDQEFVTLDIYQGSSKQAKDNTKIGSMRVDLQPKDGVQPEIEVVFNQDMEQALTVKVCVDGESYLQGFQTN